MEMEISGGKRRQQEKKKMKEKEEDTSSPEKRKKNRGILMKTSLQCGLFSQRDAPDFMLHSYILSSVPTSVPFVKSAPRLQSGLRFKEAESL